MNTDNVGHVMCHLSLWENSCYWFVVSYQKKTKKKSPVNNDNLFRNVVL